MITARQAALVAIRALGAPGVLVALAGLLFALPGIVWIALAARLETWMSAHLPPHLCPRCRRITRSLGRCPDCRSREHRRRRTAGAKHLYDARWKAARLAYLGDHPLCTFCGRRAEVVDHIEPHHGDPTRFWDEANWRALCKPCHDARTDEGDFRR